MKAAIISWISLILAAVIFGSILLFILFPLMIAVLKALLLAALFCGFFLLPLAVIWWAQRK